MIDLEAAFNAGLRAFDVPRGDELDAHASDVGKCLYDTWCRRNSKPRVKHSLATCNRLQKGLHDEPFILDRIEAGLNPEDGWQLIREHRFAGSITGHLDAVLARAKCPFPRCINWLKHFPAGTWSCSIHDHYDTATGDTVWTADRLTIERAIFDVKTTKFRWNKANKAYQHTDGGPKEHHMKQVGTYALEMPKNPDGHAPKFAFFYQCRDTNAIAFYGWFDPEDKWIRDMIQIERLRVIDLTAPGTDPVAGGIAIRLDENTLMGIPPEPWWCGYCDNAICPKNKSVDDMEIPE